MNHVAEIFGTKVFNDTAMKERLPEDAYSALQRTMKDGKKLDINIPPTISVNQ